MKEYTMKKIITIISAVIASLSLAGCSSSSTNKSNNQSKTSTVKPKPKYYFDGEKASIRDLDITITKVRFFKGLTPKDKKQIAFEYIVKNKSKKKLDITTSWLAVFNAYQDNKNTDGKLEVGSTPLNYAGKILNNQNKSIKKGGKLEGAIAYNLDSNKIPVTLKATKGVDGPKIGQKTFKLGKFTSQSNKLGVN
ncbi:DUF5067 domain-containing protein [Lactobacillus sp. ESL0230]|nr:DUF5067 domain-containing protein [Lactobacillus sp. ESL0230]